MENKKICLLTPSLQMGGIERAISTLANNFVSKGYEVHCVTLLPLNPFFKLDDRIHLYVPKLPFSRNKMSFINYLKFYSNVFSPFGYLRKTVKTIAPDTILDFCEGFPLVILSLAGLNIPLFTSKRTSPNFQPPIHLRILRFIAYSINKPSGVIVQTNAALKNKQWFLGKNIRVIPNAAREITYYDSTRQDWIVAVGRLHKEKGFDRLMKAFAKLDAPDWKLIIAGGGEHSEYFHQLSAQLKIENKIVFLGKVENIDKLLSESKIFALTSYREGFPNALCEAMVSGLPCVSFDIIAGPSDIIQDGINGFLVVDNDIEAFTERLQFLINSPEVRNKISIEAKKIKDQYSTDKIANEYLNFILP